MNLDRKAWLEERRMGIGGSDVAAVLGLSPWSTPVTVWLEKTGRAAPKEETEAMRIGIALEDFVAQRYCQETRRSVRRFNRMIHRGCMLGNFDRLVVPDTAKLASYKDEVRTDTLLECKTSSTDWDAGVPLYYQTQVQWYMGLAEPLLHADVACLFLNHKHFSIYRVERDKSVIDHIQRYCQDWWEEHIVRDIAPKPICEDDCKALWLRSNPLKTVVATAEQEKMLDELIGANRDLEKMEHRRDAIQEQIKIAMGDAEALTNIAGKTLCTWKSSKDRTKIDWESVARSMGAPQEVIDQHTTTVIGSRLFRIKKTA